MSEPPKGYFLACPSSQLAEGASISVAPSPEQNDAQSLIALFRAPGGLLYAIQNKCCHGKGKLCDGDIEDLASCEFTSDPRGNAAVPGLCVRCPKHQKKFSGGLYFSLESGESFIKGPSQHYQPDTFKVASYDVLEQNGSIFVSNTPSHGKKQSLSDRISILAQKAIRNVAPCIASSSSSSSSDHPSDGAWHTWVITAIRQLNHNCFTYTLVAPASTSPLARAISSPVWHVAVRAQLHPSKEWIERDYTPSSTTEDLLLHRRIELMVKIYPDGKMTQHMFTTWKVGMQVLLSSPTSTLLPRVVAPSASSSLPLPPSASASSSPLPSAQLSDLSLSDPISIHHVAGIFGGTGVTVALQLARLVAFGTPAELSTFFGSSDSNRNLTVFLSNRTRVDMILKEELDEIAKKRPDVVKTVYTITDGVEIELLKKHGSDSHCYRFGRFDNAENLVGLPIPSADTKVIVSGPESMWTSVSKVLFELGHQKSNCVELEA